MTVFTALLVNAYRELNSKKLFWVTLAISALVVLLYMSIGFTENGMFLFFGLIDIETEMFARGSGLDRVLYRSLFSDFIVGIWLAWALVILALVSTSTIFPDAMADGTIDLTLSKPVRRVTLFLFKYLTGLLFVTLQVALFCLGVFLAMGWRIGEWNWVIFAAVPVLTLVFSYLFAINVLVGVVTRSALAALLLTVLLWFIVFLLHTTGGVINQARHASLDQLEQAETIVRAQRERLDALPPDEVNDAERAAVDHAEAQLAEARDALDRIERWHRPARLVQALLPKTSESTALVSRWLTRDEDISMLDVIGGGVRRGPDETWVVDDRDEEARIRRRMEEELRERSLAYVVGTSLVFELVVLGVALAIFLRRDF